MKKTTRTKKNMILAVFAFLIGLGTTAAYALPGDPASPLIHIGAGDQITTDLRIGGSPATAAPLDANIPGKNVVLDGIETLADDVTPVTGATDPNASIMSTLGNAWLQDRIFVGARYETFDFALDPVTLSPIQASIVYTLGQAPLRPTGLFGAWVLDLSGSLNPTPLVADLQKINILGNLISTDLNTAAGNTTGTGQVCVDGTGTIILCG